MTVLLSIYTAWLTCVYIHRTYIYTFGPQKVKWKIFLLELGLELGIRIADNISEFSMAY